MRRLLVLLLCFRTACSWTAASNNLHSRRIRATTTTATATTSQSVTQDTHQLDERYYRMEDPATSTNTVVQSSARITLTRYLDQAVTANPELADLESLLLGLQMACKTISNLVNRAGLVGTHPEKEGSSMNNYSDGRFYSMKRLDQLSTLVLKNALKYTGKYEVVTPAVTVNTESPAEHQPGVLIAKSLDSPYVACLDPLDGSGNADASICTGTVFGVFHESEKSQDENPNGAISPEQRTEELVKAVLQPAKNMRAAGYCLYSSATVLVFTLGDTVQGFTLDPQLNEFVLTHPNLTIPARGTVYSCNEANSEGWDENFRNYLYNLKTGNGRSKKRYAHRYVGSMVGDLHRTLLYGGLFAYPADTATHPEGNLQLLYKTAPMAVILDRAGGKCIDGRGNSLLDIRPARVHQKRPCFLGSPDDVTELESYLFGQQQ
jgi:fructose-1,6-bisphosphatase I